MYAYYKNNKSYTLNQQLKIEENIRNFNNKINKNAKRLGTLTDSDFYKLDDDEICLPYNTKFR